MQLTIHFSDILPARSAKETVWIAHRELILAASRDHGHLTGQLCSKLFELLQLCREVGRRRSAVRLTGLVDLP